MTDARQNHSNNMDPCSQCCYGAHPASLNVTWRQNRSQDLAE